MCTYLRFRLEPPYRSFRLVCHGHSCASRFHRARFGFLTQAIFGPLQGVASARLPPTPSEPSGNEARRWSRMPQKHVPPAVHELQARCAPGRCAPG